MLFEEKLDERGVLTLSLNRPEIHNAFNDEMIASLTKRFNEISCDESIRLVLFCGNGKSFCAGADLNWMKAMKNYSDAENFEDSKRLALMLEAINRCSKPVIGKVHGAALGGGSGLVSCCDYVIADESTKFGFTEVMLGLVPAVISPYVVNKIGESNARALFLTGERFDSNKAKEIGLVHQVSLERHFHNDAEDVIKKFLKSGPKAQSVAKSLVENILTISNEEVMDYTCRTIAAQRTSDEGQEGMTALLEKRKPNWLEGKK